MDELVKIGNIPVSYAAFASIYPDYKSRHNKVSKLEKSGDLIRLKRGLYVVSPKVSGKLLSTELIANHIYGPSYVSRESALRYYGLIPEAVYMVRSMTTKRSRDFKNVLGKFEYTECPKAYFPIGIRRIVDGEVAFLMASPEKALCYLLLYTPNLNLRFQKETAIFLEENLRFDMDAFKEMNAETFRRCMEAGKKKEVINNILKLLNS